MKKTILTNLVVIAAITLGAHQAYALPQTQSTIFDSTWTIIATDEEGPSPGSGGQKFDAEYLAYKIIGDDLWIGLQTGFDLSDGKQLYGGKTYYSGDIALSFDGNVITGDTSTVASTYEYAVDFGFTETRDYNLNLVGGAPDTPGIYEVTTWNNNLINSFEPISSPFAMDSGILKDAALASEIEYATDGTSHFRAMSFDVATLGLSISDGFILDAHWTMSCGNDNINGTAPVPEPATMLLFGTGLAGLAGAYRRKKK